MSALGGAAARIAALAAAALLAGCAGDVTGPRLTVKTVDDFTIVPLLSSDQEIATVGGCPADGPEVTTQPVSAFPVELVISAQDNNGVSLIALELDGATVIDQDRLERNGGVISARPNGGVAVAWSSSEGAARDTLRGVVRIEPAPDQLALREIGVRALAQDVSGKEAVTPARDQAPIGVATVAMACRPQG
ncbi:MAG: hypothetical protein AAFW46_12535 [Pseudomonadota bacterium]